MKKGIITALLAATIFILCLTCQTHQFGATYEMRDDAGSLGGFYGADVIEYLEASLIYNHNIYPVTAESNISSIGLNYNLKYPFYLANDFLTIYPIAGFEGQMIISLSDLTEAARFGLGIKFGGGFDISLTPSLFLRGTALYQPEITTFLDGSPGLRFNMGLGLRTSEYSPRRTTNNIRWHGDFGYKIEGREENQTVTIINYRGRGMNKEVTIPSVINGLPVTRIDGMEKKIRTSSGRESSERRGAFQDEGNSSGGRNYMITSVTIPSSVRTIGENAFRNNQLTSVTIGNSVTSIGNYAFWNNKLTSVTIGNSVTSIGNYAFSRNQLTSVTIPGSITTISDRAFSDNQLTSVTISEGVRTIRKNAFYGNQLISVTVPGSVREIGEYAFSNNNLVDVNISNGVTTIGVTAFGDNLLTNVVIPRSVREIGQNAFMANPLTSVTIPEGVIKIGNNAFAINRPLNRDTNEVIRTRPDMAVGSLHPYIIAYGSGTYTKEGDRVLRNGQYIREPATLITDFTDDGRSFKRGPIYFLSIDGKSPDQCSTTSVRTRIFDRNVDSSKIPASLLNATLYYDATYVAPGMHSVEVTYFDVVEYTIGNTIYTNTLWSQDSVTWEHRYLFDGGVYKFTVRMEGDKIVYRIEPQ